MTIQETRQLGIEFERRVYTAIPQKEFLDKLDTETIYSFLNQFQDVYVTQLHKAEIDAEPGKETLGKIDSILKPLLVTKVYEKSERVPSPVNQLDLGRQVCYELPNDYAYYVRSTSELSSAYRYKNPELSDRQPVKVVTNQLVQQKDLAKVVESPFDSFRIQRTPVIAINNEDEGIFSILFDSYTTIERVAFTYYKRPNRFTILTSTPCELPMDAFDDLVSGAVGLYIQYAAGGQQPKQKKEDEQENKGE